MRFEWEPEKELANIKKHGVTFIAGSKVFDDPNYVLLKDRIDEQTGEQRWNAIGMVNESALIVAHVYRGKKNEEEIVRIYSARQASKRECGLYFQ